MILAGRHSAAGASEIAASVASGALGLAFALIGLIGVSNFRGWTERYAEWVYNVVPSISFFGRQVPSRPRVLQQRVIAAVMLVLGLGLFVAAIYRLAHP
jgi:hypothetical protein